MNSEALSCCCRGPVAMAASMVQQVLAVHRSPAFCASSQLLMQSCRLRVVASRKARTCSDIVQVVALQESTALIAARRIFLVALYGCSSLFARCGAWGWLLPVAAVSAHVLLAGFRMTSAPVRSRLDFRRARKAKSAGCVMVVPDSGKATLRKLRSSSSSLRFKYHGQYYELQGEGASMVATAVLQQSETLLSLCQRVRHGGLDESDVMARRQEYGNNDCRIAVPPLFKLVCSRLLRPIFLFELASVLLWGLDGYWQFTLLSFGTLVCFEIGAAMSRHKSLSQLHTAATAAQAVLVLRSGEWASKSAVDLVPGDIIQVFPNTDVPCDALLLEGSATVSEAALSGESAPVTKCEVLPEARMPDTGDLHCTLYAGTKVLAARHSGDAASCICAVLKTGFYSRQGLLMRRAVASQESIRDKDTLKVVALLLGFAAVAASEVAIHRSTATGNIWVQMSIILSFVVQPTLPLLMTYAVQRTLEVLRTKEVICAEPLRVLEAAAMSLCFFDKTGTLTSDRLEVAGVALPESLAHVQDSDFQLGPLRGLQPAEPAFRILQHCHSVTSESGQLFGDPLETAVLQELGPRRASSLTHSFCTSSYACTAYATKLVRACLLLRAGRLLSRTGRAGPATIGRRPDPTAP